MQDLFAFTVSPWELIVRATAMYWFIYLLLRLILRRDVGSIAIADVLLLENMRKQLITSEELKAELRAKGIERFEDVKMGRLESDGEITLVLKRDPGIQSEKSKPAGAASD